MSASPALVVDSSPLSFADTTHAVQAGISRRGLRLFSVIDHEAAAREAGLELRPTQVFIFGSPAGGTPLMDAHPLLALELPLRILVWQDDDGMTMLAALAADAVVAQFDLPAPAPALAVPAAIIGEVVDGR